MAVTQAQNDLYENQISNLEQVGENTYMFTSEVNESQYKASVSKKPGGGTRVEVQSLEGRPVPRKVEEVVDDALTD